MAPSSCKWDSKSSETDWSKEALSWLARMELLWLVGEDTDEAIAVRLQLDGKSLSLIDWNIIPGTPLEELVQRAFLRVHIPQKFINLPFLVRSRKQLFKEGDMLEKNLQRYVPARRAIGHGNHEGRRFTASSARIWEGRRSCPPPSCLCSPSSKALWLRRPFVNMTYTWRPPSHTTTGGSLMQEKGLPAHGFALGELSPR